MNNIDAIAKGIIEEHADLEHEIWSSWMQYMFSKCVPQPDGSLLIPPSLVYHWKRQMSVPYEALSEKEKDSDREQVEKHLLLIRDGYIDRCTINLAKRPE